MRIGWRAVRVSAALAGAALCTLATPRLASAEWPAFGRAISDAPGGQTHSVVASDGAGGAIVAWQDSRSPRINIFAGHVLASGDPDAAWPENGRALLTDWLAMASADGGQNSPVIVADGAGGAIVAWQDERSAVTGTDLFAQHVLASGAVDPAWPANGAAVSAAGGLQNTLAIAPDGAGGAIVTWVDARPGTAGPDIYAQRLLATGIADPRWLANGVAVCAAPGAQAFPVLIPDGSGGAIIGWDDARDAATGPDIYAQHVLGSGVADPAWPANGRALCAAPGGQARPSIAADGANGAIVAWTDSRVVGTAHIFAQHVLGTGAVDDGWPANGRAISAAGLLESRPLAVPDGAGGAVVAWQAFTVHLNMFAQHVLGSGVVDPAWPAAGRALSLTPRLQSHAEAVPDGAGGAIVAWEDSSDVFAQHVLSSGALDVLYPDTGRAVCNLPGAQGDVSLVATGDGGAIVAWTDGRSGVSADIFALQVLDAGTLDVPPDAAPGITFARPAPNPASGPLVLRFALPHDGRVRLTVYDVNGRRVRALVSGAESAGEHAVAWDLRDDDGRAVGTGLYFARLEAGRLALTHKLVTAR